MDYDFEDHNYDAERTGESLDAPIADRGGDTIDNDDSDQDSEANFKRHGHKKRKTVTANTSSAPLGDSFFNGITSCSDMPNLKYVIALLFV